MVLMLSDATDSLIFPEEVCLFYSSDLLWRVHDARLSVPEGLLKHMPGACLLPAGPTPLSSPSPARHEKPLGSTLGRHDFNNEKKHMDHDQLIRARVTNYLILLSKGAEGGNDKERSESYGPHAARGTGGCHNAGTVSLSLSQPVAVCLTASLPRPAVQVRVTSAPRHCVSPRETRLPSSHLMQMLRSPGLVQACVAREARLKCDETEWREPIGGLGSWLRCVLGGGC